MTYRNMKQNELKNLISELITINDLKSLNCELVLNKLVLWFFLLYNLLWKTGSNYSGEV